LKIRLEEEVPFLDYEYERLLDKEQMVINESVLAAK
jgi:hypothetical protein